ncbi:MAG: hypothetical protein OXQ29_15885 [Rhodospirillaceae bacterium]|nr:hypothetical protein [Rhodospirillaceae bacterium]
MPLLPASPSPGEGASPTDVPVPYGLHGAADLFGPAHVIDGDTLDIGGTPVRLHGVDAHKGAQSCFPSGTGWPCGRRATQALAILLQGGVRPECR